MDNMESLDTVADLLITGDTSRVSRLTRNVGEHTVSTMSFRVKIGRFEVETDSADEAYEFLRRLENNDSGSKALAIINTKASIPTAEWSVAAFDIFRGLLKGQPQQRTLIIALYEAGEKGLMKDELIRKCALDSARKLAGPLSGLAKNAAKAGIGGDAAYTVERFQQGGQRTSRYKINPALRLMFDGICGRHRSGPSSVRA